MCAPAASQRASSCSVEADVRWAILIFDPVPAALLAQMLAQQLAGARIEHADGGRPTALSRCRPIQPGGAL